MAVAVLKYGLKCRARICQSAWQFLVSWSLCFSAEHDT